VTITKVFLEKDKRAGMMPTEALRIEKEKGGGKKDDLKKQV